MEPRRPERLTTKNIFRNFFEDLLNADRGMWGTIVQMTLRPRRVIKTFLFEDRGRFIRPTRYVIFSLSIAALTFVAVQWRYGQPLHEYLRPTIEARADEMVLDLRESAARKAEASGKPITPEREAANEKIRESLREQTIRANTNLIKYGNYLGLLGIPVIALFYWLMFPRVSFNYPEHLAATGYIYGHANLLNLLPLPFILLASSPVGLLQAMLYGSLFTLSYQTYATWKVYVRSVKEFLLATVILVLAVSALMLLISSASYVLGYLLAASNEEVANNCENCGLNWWKVLRVVPPLFFAAALLLIRLRPKRWLLGSGVAVLSLAIYFFLVR